MTHPFESLLLSKYSQKHVDTITENKKSNLSYLYAAKLLASSTKTEILGENLLFLWFLCEHICLGKICFHLLIIEQEIRLWINKTQPKEENKRIPFPIPTLEQIHSFIESSPNLFRNLNDSQLMVPFYFEINAYVLFPQRVFLICKEIYKEINIRNQMNSKQTKEWEEIHLFLEKYKDPSIKLEEKEIEVCKSLLDHNVTIITGGPGTGKTTCIFLGLTSLLHSWECSKKSIFLLAPTGRAAAQLKESLTSRVTQSCKEIQDLVGKSVIESSTIHKFLKISNPNNEKYSPDSPLEADMIVVDESSMLSMGILYQLFCNTPTKTKLVFVGDPFQLPPVKEFNILFDLLEILSEEKAKYLVTLEKQRRSETEIQKLSSHLRSFEKDSEITSKILKAFRNNEAKKIIYIPKSPSIEEILQILQIEFKLESLIFLSKNLTAPFSEKQQLDNLGEMFSILQNFSFLQATKSTPLGSIAINEYCLNWLREQGDKIVYPICVTKNEHDLEIYNGDRGLYLEYKNQPQKNVAIFLNSKKEHGYQFVSPSLLKLETAFTQTVHKSQGSEFKKVILFLEQESLVTTRSLLYTAITRAKEWFCLISEESVLEYAVENISSNKSSIFKFAKNSKNESNDKDRHTEPR